MSVIANTTVISNFASIGQLELLHQLYTTLHISTEVYGEVQEGVDEGYSFYADIHPLCLSILRSWMALSDQRNRRRRTAAVRRNACTPASGEASCIAIAHFRGWQFLTMI